MGLFLVGYLLISDTIGTSAARAWLDRFEGLGANAVRRPRTNNTTKKGLPSTRHVPVTLVA